MQQRLRRYNVENWAADFMRALNKVQSIQENYFSKKITASILKNLVNKFKEFDNNRIIFT